jgi:hypothetical protein
MLALFNFFKPHLFKLFRNDEGQVVTEYVMLVLLVAIAAFLTSPSMANTLHGAIDGISSVLIEHMSS